MCAIEVGVREIVDAGTTDLDTDLALFAIRSYARRNFIPHNELREISRSKNSDAIDEYLDRDDKLLEEILPDEEKHTVGKWRRVLKIYRNTRRQPDGGGDRVAKVPLRVSSGSSPPPTGRLGRAVLRCEIEMGLKRGSNSPDGPPPTNVTFDPSLFRRRSEPGRRPSHKRPAVGQPLGESSPKKAKGPYCGKRLEAIPEDINDGNVWEAEELQLQLHTLSVELPQTKPGAAVSAFQQQLAVLKHQSEWTTAGVEKRKRASRRKSASAPKRKRIL